MATATIDQALDTSEQAAAPTACPSCGADVEPGWRFCERCSAPLAAAGTHRAGLASIRAGLSTSPWMRIAMVAAILAIVIVGAVVMTQRTQHTLDRTKTTLKNTQHQLTATQGQLATTTKARDDFKAQLDAKNAELSSKISELTGTKSQLDTFKTCLNGVKRAVDYANAGDDAAANHTLDSVQSACDAVDRLI